MILLRRLTDGYTTFAEVYRYVLDNSQIDRDIRRLKTEASEPSDAILVPIEEYRLLGKLRSWTHWFEENPEHMATWARQGLERFRALGDRWHAGPLEQIECLGPQRHVALASQAETEFCVGWKHSMSAGQIREMMKKVLALWAS